MSFSTLRCSRTRPPLKGMTIRIGIEPEVLFYEPSLLERWRQGDRSYCSDAVCRKLSGSSGFGEYVVGSHFESQGYKWIHHDFDIFGTNRPGKYPVSEAVLLQHLGEERLSATRALFRTLHPFREPEHDPIETPDLLIFRPDASEIRFAECKRTDTADKLNRRQALGLALIAAALRCPVDLFWVAPVGVALSQQPIEVEFPYFAQ